MQWRGTFANQGLADLPSLVLAMPGWGVILPKCHTLTKCVIDGTFECNFKWENTMNVSLTPELEKFVNNKVEAGRYNSASEVVREALRLLEENDRSRAAQLSEFNQELGRRLASLESGVHVDPSEARSRLRRKSEERRNKKA